MAPPPPHETPVFIYDLPYGVRSDLVTSLDAGDAWRELAGARLRYDSLKVQRFSDARHKSGTSPADALLVDWGQRNHTADELFKHLHALGLQRSMTVLKPCVSKSLHGFLRRPPSQMQPHKREQHRLAAGETPPRRPE